MNPIIKSLIEEISSLEEGDDFGEAIYYASDVCSKYRMKGFTSHIYPEIDKMIFKKDEIERLRDVLVKRLDKKPDSEYAVGIIAALSHLGDPSLKKLFEKYLEIFLKKAIRCDHGLNSVEIALSLLGTKIIKGGSQGIGDYEKNVNQAKEYFAKKGIVFPL